MRNVAVRDVLYIILIVIDFLLNIVYGVAHWVLLSIKLIFRFIIDENMLETSKKRKRNSNVEPNQTVTVRGFIDANWRKLLSNNLIMNNNTETPKQEKKTDHFTGTFRRARKKKAKDDLSGVVQNVTTLNLTQTESKTAANIKNDPTINERVNAEGVKKNKLTKYLAMDCEMVGVGYEGNDHMVARVSIVNKFGDCVYDKFVKAREEVKDYRTSISGVRKEDLLNGEEFTTVQKEVAELLKGRILVGHSLKNDMSVLFLSHPKRNIRDTARYKPFKKITKGSTPSLKRLAKEILGVDIQQGEHSSVEDARATMKLYCTVAKQWEAGLCDKRGYKKLNDE